MSSYWKKLKKLFSKKEPERDNIPKNWVPELIKKETTETQEDGTVKIIHEIKKPKRYWARPIKRVICMILIIANFIMLGTCFFTQGGIMAPFFFFNTVFLSDYFWKSRSQPLENYG